MVARTVLAFMLVLTAGTVHAEIPGLSALLDRPGLRYLVFGDLHGTEELPAFFGDVVAEAAARRPVSVVLEYPERWQRDLDRYLASPGDADARKALLATDFWSQWRDGRSSRAMFALIEKLRTLRVPVTACQPNGSAGDPGAYERVMGDCWKQVTAEIPRQLTLIFVGDAHASFTPVFSDYMPAATQLPREQTVSLDDLPAPGWSWHCEGVDKCREFPTHAAGTPEPRGIYIGHDVPAELGLYDGVYSSGPHFTASPPAAAAN